MKKNLVVPLIIATVLALSACGGNEPSAAEKWQAAWNDMSGEMQDTICRGWETSPNTAAETFALALGFPEGGKPLAEQLLNQVC